jgi:CRP/FNR family transcriptional regulator, cyclic AMP receptor protein
MECVRTLVDDFVRNVIVSQSNLWQALPFYKEKKDWIDKMVMLTNLDLIRRVPLFSLLNPEHAQMVADTVIKRRFKRGEILVEQGKKTNFLYIILTGRARVLTSDTKGREVILATLHPGDHLGEMSLIDNETHSATVRAEVQTDVLVLDRSQFARLLPENTSMAYAVMKGLVQRLRHADRKIESLALMDVYGRVARALMEQADPNAQGELVIREKISRQDIAKMVGASREMVSRVMKDLEEQGFIETREDGSMLVRDRLNSLG